MQREVEFMTIQRLEIVCCTAAYQLIVWHTSMSMNLEIVAKNTLKIHAFTYT